MSRRQTRPTFSFNNTHDKPMSNIVEKASDKAKHSANATLEEITTEFGPSQRSEVLSEHIDEHCQLMCEEVMNDEVEAANNTAEIIKLLEYVQEKHVNGVDRIAYLRFNTGREDETPNKRLEPTGPRTYRTHPEHGSVFAYDYNTGETLYGPLSSDGRTFHGEELRPTTVEDLLDFPEACSSQLIADFQDFVEEFKGN